MTQGGRLQDLIPYDTRANQPAAADVAEGTLYCVSDEGGIVERSNGATWDSVGGGSAPVGVPVTYAFPFAFDTAGLDAGVPVYTPVVGEELVDFRVEIGTAFDGTTPYADLCHVLAQGLFAWTIGQAIPLGAADVTTNGLSQGGVQYYGQSGVEAGTFNGYRTVPATFLTTDPLLLVVSQDGLKDGDPIGGAAGAAILYFTICTPITL
jgi:hypothetical protein